MLFLTAAGTTQPDYVALAMVLVLAAFVAFKAVQKYMSKKRAAEVAVDLTANADAPLTAAAAVDAPVAPGSAGKLKLHDVEPKAAAMLMAIVADKLGKPLNELRFISIKEVK